MDAHNPYQTPTARLDLPPVSTDQLASRGRRFAGSLLDGLFQVLLILPLFFVVGVFDDQLLLSETPLAVFTLLAGIGSYLLLNGYLLYHHGQTLAKRLLDMRIVYTNNEPAEFHRLFLLRVLPVWVASAIPVVGSFLSLVDALFIFGAERRCLHDQLAGTKVVRVTAAEPAAAIA